jgi:transketolase C-terminal domain/subunit
VDREGLIKAAKESSGLVLTVEENYAHGGIFDVVCQALSKEKDTVIH